MMVSRVTCHVSFLLLRMSWMMGPSSPRRRDMVHGSFQGRCKPCIYILHEGDLAPKLTRVIGLWERAYDDLQLV